MSAELLDQHVEVLRLVAQGFTDREVGERLDISQGAARNLLYRANRILGAHTRIRAVVLAHELGLLEAAA